MDNAQANGIQWLARLGYAAKGVVYMLIALMAAAAALGSGAAGDSREAMLHLDRELLGKVALAIVGAGLLAYAFWRIYSAIANPEHDKPGPRLMHAGTGIINAGLGLEALRVAGFQGGSNAGNNAPHWAAQVMAQPFGVWIVAAGGLGFAGYGMAQLVRAFRAKLDDQLRLGEIGAWKALWVRRLARIGLAARGIVFGVVGIYLIKSALNHDPGQARDLGASLQAVHDQPYGTVLLGLVAVGLFLYGFYNLIRARYRLINP